MATNNVQVVEKNAGTKIQWEQRNYILAFDDDALTVKVPRYQMDEEHVVDICEDRAGNLVIGAASGIRYIAQIVIPPAEYEEITEGEGDEQTTTRIRKDLDMADVVLVLWSVD